MGYIIHNKMSNFPDKPPFLLPPTFNHAITWSDLEDEAEQDTVSVWRIHITVYQ